MENKKNIICTVLFATVLIGVIIGTMFIKNEHINLYRLFANCIVIAWTNKQIGNFYHWLQEE